MKFKTYSGVLDVILHLGCFPLPIGDDLLKLLNLHIKISNDGKEIGDSEKKNPYVLFPLFVLFNNARIGVQIHIQISTLCFKLGLQFIHRSEVDT